MSKNDDATQTADTPCATGDHCAQGDRAAHIHRAEAPASLLRSAAGGGALGSDTAPVILSPHAAAEAVCHDEQMTVWESDFVGMLSLGGWLRDDLDYAEGIELGHAVKRELRSIIEMAFDHPEAKTVTRKSS